MRRLPVHLLLLGCSGLLLVLSGSSTPVANGEDEDGSGGSGARRARRPGVYRAAAPIEKGAAFRLPRDASGVLLAKALPPTAPPAALQSPSRPAPRPVPQPKFVEPHLPLPPVTPGLPRMPELVKKAPIRPEFVQDEDLEESFAPLETPTTPSFVAGKRVNVPSVSSSLPPPLPIMAQPGVDRVPLDDATMEVSTETVLAAAMPPRNKALAYQRTTTPDPYEHRIPLTVSLPEEQADPESAAPQPPRR